MNRGPKKKVKRGLNKGRKLRPVEEVDPVMAHGLDHVGNLLLKHNAPPQHFRASFTGIFVRCQKMLNAPNGTRTCLLTISISSVSPGTPDAGQLLKPMEIDVYCQMAAYSIARASKKGDRILCFDCRVIEVITKSAGPEPDRRYGFYTKNISNWTGMAEGRFVAKYTEEEQRAEARAEEKGLEAGFYEF